MVTLMAMVELVQDPFKDHLREHLFIRQARLGARGNYDKYKFNVQMSIAGDENLVTGANNSSNVTMLDYYADLPLLNSGLTLRLVRVSSRCPA